MEIPTLTSHNIVGNCSYTTNLIDYAAHYILLLQFEYITLISISPIYGILIAKDINSINQYFIYEGNTL